MSSSEQQASRSEACLASRAICWPTETGPRNPQASYYRARYYDQNTGRFASEDPIRSKGGINFYAYVSNNPVTLTDPTGLLPGGVGPEGCDYYDKRCKTACPPDPYACKAGQCCRDFGTGPKQNCVRKCLIEGDKICTQNSPNSLTSCRFVNHVVCYTECGFRPTSVPDSCLKIALGF
jgi:RHS repeat-associated protein